jgi:hypothetical protein
MSDMKKKLGAILILTVIGALFTGCNIQIGWHDADDRYIVDDDSTTPQTYSPPSAVITAPVNNETVYNITINLCGNAVSGSYPLDGVYISVNDGIYIKITAGDTWNQTFYAEEGEYNFDVYATDIYGNCSVTNSITNVRVVK